MTVTTYTGWVADGKPAKPAQPIADMMAMFRRYGYTVYYLPDERHQKASPPEDHDPYSHTPWPGAQPYPYVLACDLMPKSGTDARALAPIARRIIADKDAGRAPWVKYLNWTDEQGKVWHTKWQPSKVTSTSTDSGHIHISIRTDYVTSGAAAGWDPVEPLQGTAAQPGGNMTSTNTDAFIAAYRAGNPTASDGGYVEPVKWEIAHEAWEKQTSAALTDLAAKVDALTAKVGAPTGDLNATLSDDEVQRIAAAFVAALHAAPITVTVQ